MAIFKAEVSWERGDASFSDSRYSRAHRWRFDGGVEIPASASPHVVPVPLSDASAVDPEEAFVAAISSCHMLWFLAIAAKRGWIVDRYVDRAEGRMANDSDGKSWIGQVVLHPTVSFSGDGPGFDELAAIHRAAHDECFIARSVKTEIIVSVD